MRNNILLIFNRNINIYSDNGTETGHILKASLLTYLVQKYSQISVKLNWRQSL